ncbi:MAG: ATP-binding protein [Bacteroidota bacterium]
MTLDLNTNIDNQLAGFRLNGLEVFNWGTFHAMVWNIRPGGKNALLTGDIGSGKSTLVDAVTTLLVPSRKIVYNKAAGAETRERNLRTYVQGAYKNEKVAQSAKARDVYLRPGNAHYSVIVANFDNAGTGECVALAQVLWMGTPGTVNRLYVVADRTMTIGEDFSHFGGEINRLRRKLRADNQVRLHQSFQNYAVDFRRRFGIRQPEALDLFYQTVSMKQVGNLTEFVRERMLGQTKIEKQIETLLKSYDDANAAHQAVMTARRQLDTLAPLIQADTARTRTLVRIEELEKIRAEVPAYFAYEGIRRRQESLGEVRRQWTTNRDDRLRQTEKLSDQEAALNRLKRLLEDNDVYRQLAPLEHNIQNAQEELTRRRAQARRYADGLAKIETTDGTDVWRPAANAVAFVRQREKLLEWLAKTEIQLSELDRSKGKLHVEWDKAHAELDEINAELRSLRERPTLIPRRNLALRDQLLAALNLTAEELPFAGELLRVKESAGEWEGAIERVLNGLGLSVLVPDRHYVALSKVANQMHLGGRLVYLRTLPHRGRVPEDTGGERLVDKVSIKGDSEHYDWLERELEVRYNYRCCDSLEEFQRATRGLTKHGQVKTGRHRHDKDDRFRIDDRRRYILGWTNQSKIAALEKNQRQATKDLQVLTRALEEHQLRVGQLNAQRDVLLNLSENFPEFNPLDVASASTRLQDLENERRTLMTRSDEVTELKNKIEQSERAVSVARREQTELTKRTGRLENKCLNLTQLIHEGLAELGLPQPAISVDPDAIDVPALLTTYEALDIEQWEPSEGLLLLLKELAPEQQSEKAILHRFTGEEGLLGKQQRKLRKHERKIMRQMTEFRKDFPEASRDVDAELDALPDYRRIHQQLQRDKLPEFEGKFRRLLKEGTIRNIVSFQNQLQKYEQEIEEKIARINTHLQSIDYNEGSYVVITSEPIRSDDILGFKRDLRACLSGTLDGSKDVYNEAKFQQVKKLLDRFEGATETDRRWTRRVTDVRQWYEFGADERSRVTHDSLEFYSDSSGKSGGQKEKLAYTILASAIAFQFGLQAGKSTDRSFRFVVIDEAFGRGSDDSTRYGLRLFERLNLQLLIVTPLQKINVIEDYVATVHYVDNPGGNNSRVRNISIEEYREERKRRKT